ncbi:hypothetical protein [Microcoleus sp. CAWBG24]|nr:hypothetical protein [Microcoleus sp. CAWBG24]
MLFRERHLGGQRDVSPCFLQPDGSSYPRLAGIATANIGDGGRSSVPRFATLLSIEPLS